MPIAGLAIVMNGPVKDELKDVGSLRHLLLSKPEVQFLLSVFCVFKADFLTTEALSFFKIWVDGMVHFGCFLFNRFSFKIVLGDSRCLSRKTSRNEFLSTLSVKERTPPFSSSVRLRLALWFPGDKCLSISLYSSTDHFALLLLIRSWIAFALRNRESIFHIIHWSSCLAMILLFGASCFVLVFARMRRGIAIAPLIGNSSLESFKMSDRISFKVSVKLRPF